MTIEHNVRVYKSEENLAREDQLAHKIAKVAADPVAVTAEVSDMIINRVIDNASVAIASLNRAPIVAARAQALAHAPEPTSLASPIRFPPSGLLGPTALPSASWITTTPSYQLNTPTRPIISPRFSLLPSTRVPPVRTCSAAWPQATRSR